MALAVIFGIIMGIAHYLSKPICRACRKYKNQLKSLSAGISITYIFLHLFPQFSYGVVSISKLLFLSIIAGFALLHVVEKYIYQHSPKEKLLKELALEDSIASFVYHFVVGIILVSFARQGFFEGLLFFIPVLLHTSISTLPVDVSKYKWVNAIVASSTLLGILFVEFIYTNMGILVYFSLLGFIIGALFFTVTRHSIPKGISGKPLFFVIGVIIYSILVLML